ncbi:HET-domain-containing protein [Hypoxylon argillaceum]|nr:HET-domain-containing protein [Hypoxylon argillaceum]
MASSVDYDIYEPLPNATSIRILLLAPGSPDDSDIYFGLITSDLDCDHGRFPNSTPPPVENLSFVTAEQSADGDEAQSQFPIYLDMNFESDPPERRMHAFQRYEALSYVWGDLSDPEHIFMDGGVPLPVTKNLYAALRSLRLPRSGRKLWIDALCINQSDYGEKKDQLGLMKRVYEQAEKVIAYLPLSAPDQSNINELVPKIMRASLLYRQHQQSEEKAGSELGQYTGPFNSISNVKTTKLTKNEDEPLSTALVDAFGENKLYLESFGLPREDSPLWDSWRRLFASPYFRRVWIRQEVTLGNNLHIWFGSGEGDAAPLIFAHHLLDQYSASMNSSYNAAWCDSDEDNKDTLKERLVGSANAKTMFRERIFTGRGRPQRRLIEVLATVGSFDATDPRDKIYALLGLARDGAFFAQHVSYAPSDSVERTFARFAKLFIDRGEGIEVLLQAGFHEEEDEWPSWVPHWENLKRTAGSDTARWSGETPTHIQIDESNQNLVISGAILDDIEFANDVVLEALQVTLNGVSITRFLHTIVSGFGMIFGAFSPRDPEEIFEQLFYVLAQPKVQHKISIPKDSDPTTALQDSLGTLDLKENAGSSTTTKAGGDVNSEDDQETRILRTGFHEFLNYIMSLKDQLSNAEEGVTQVTQRESPAEYQAFLKRAIETTAHCRLCITKGGRIGMAPKRSKVGDKVAVFEGCDIHFVLRRVESLPGSNSNEGEVEENGEMTYRLVGPAFFHMPETGSSGATVKNIRIR